jgi:hypothetical protein
LQCSRQYRPFLTWISTILHRSQFCH